MPPDPHSLSESERQLLARAGLERDSSWEEKSAEELEALLQNALQEGEELPSREKIDSWREEVSAESQEASGAAPAEPRPEEDEELLEVLRHAPRAQFIALAEESPLELEKISEVIYLDHLDEDREVFVEREVVDFDISSFERGQRASESHLPFNRKDERAVGLDLSRVKRMDEVQKESAPLPALEHRGPVPGKAESAPIAAKHKIESESESEKRIRGVALLHPMKVWFGGVFTLASQVLLVAALALTPMLFQGPEWGWTVWVSAALFLCALLYLILAVPVKCRVCRQPLYVPKRIPKDRQAAKLPLMGYVGGLAVHSVFTLRCRCPYCGTILSLKD
ncbi:MAG: hypothetical protein AAF555_01230 [Verrucomicrobiota bacterium]